MVRRNDGGVAAALAILAALTMVVSLVPVVRSAPGDDKQQDAVTKPESKPRKVKAFVQPKPGAAREEIEMTVHPVPVDPPMVSADDAEMDDDEIVLGVTLGIYEVAFPIRYLAMFEVVNSHVGKMRSDEASDVGAGFEAARLASAALSVAGKAVVSPWSVGHIFVATTAPASRPTAYSGLLATSVALSFIFAIFASESILET